jgi:hypothetical protein
MQPKREFDVDEAAQAVVNACTIALQPSLIACRVRCAVIAQMGLYKWHDSCAASSPRNSY